MAAAHRSAVPAAVLACLLLLAAPASAQVCANPNVIRSANQPLQCSGGSNDGTICYEAVHCPGGTCANINAPGQCVGGTNDGNACTYSFDCPGGRCGQPLTYTEADGIHTNTDSLCTAWDDLAAQGLLVADTAHGFSVNQWLMHNGATNAWQLLDSSAVTIDNNATGFITAVPDVNSYILTLAGAAAWTHGLGIGPLYASSTPGTLTDTAPPLGSIEWLAAVSSSAGSIVIVQRDWSQL